MTISLAIDAPGGADFQGYHVRNMASLHIGGASPAEETLEVTGTGLFSEELEAAAIILGIVAKTASYTAVVTDSTILCDAT